MVKSDENSTKIVLKKRSDSFKPPEKRGFTVWNPFWDSFEA